MALPTATLEDDFATMHLNTEAKVKYAHAFLFQPYPATELGEFTVDNGLMAGSFAEGNMVVHFDNLVVQGRR